MKQLKFANPLPERVLNGEKTATWRINDKKGIVKGDKLSLCYHDGREFAKAIAIRVKETRFKDLTEEDWKGHEKFSSEEEMYKTYSDYYGFEVTPETKVKLIRFRLL